MSSLPEDKILRKANIDAAMTRLHRLWLPSELFVDVPQVSGNAHGGPGTLSVFFIEATDALLLRDGISKEDETEKEAFRTLIKRYIDCKLAFHAQTITEEKFKAMTNRARNVLWTKFRVSYLRQYHNVEPSEVAPQESGLASGFADSCSNQTGGTPARAEASRSRLTGGTTFATWLIT